MTVFATKEFARFRRKAGLSAQKLLDAAADVRDGHFDADLGGGVFKQRVAREGSGKSGGFRTIIVFRAGRHSFFVHGFAKNEKANVTTKELTALRQLADVLLQLSAGQIEATMSAGELIEVTTDARAEQG